MHTNRGQQFCAFCAFYFSRTAQKENARTQRATATRDAQMLFMVEYQNGTHVCDPAMGQTLPLPPAGSAM
eukprot:14832-Amphidinium_carterae.1